MVVAGSNLQLSTWNIGHSEKRDMMKKISTRNCLHLRGTATGVPFGGRHEPEALKYIEYMCTQRYPYGDLPKPPLKLFPVGAN